MKVAIPKKEDGFKAYSHDFCGLNAFLIVPEINAKWNKKNLFYRSLIVDKKGNVLSSGWPKFFNYGEKAECYPQPDKYKDWRIEEKLDGTLVICDFVNGRFSMRTRGSVSYLAQQNFKDFELLTTLYPGVVEHLKNNSHLSLLFELVTPNNVIVIRQSDVQFYFLGAIDKTKLKVVDKYELDIDVPVPQEYSFSKISNLVEAVKHWKGQEGVVLSYNKGKNRIKVKSNWYCWIHKVKSQFNCDKNLIEFYVEEGMPTYEKFYKIIETNFDFELASQLQKDIERMVAAGEKVSKVLTSVSKLTQDIRNLETRKEQAKIIQQSYVASNKHLVPLAFSFLDNKEITKDQLQKLMHLYVEKQENSVKI